MLRAPSIECDGTFAGENRGVGQDVGHVDHAALQRRQCDRAPTRSRQGARRPKKVGEPR